jgi:hypothetical protein
MMVSSTIVETLSVSSSGILPLNPFLRQDAAATLLMKDPAKLNLFGFVELIGKVYQETFA